MTLVKECISELDKWDKVHEDSVTLQSFLEFVGNKGIFLQSVKDDGTYHSYVASKQSDTDLIYEFFGIDFTKLEQERRNLLEKIRN